MCCGGYSVSTVGKQPKCPLNLILWVGKSDFPLLENLLVLSFVVRKNMEKSTFHRA
jgi:hypothetical protein